MCFVIRVPLSLLARASVGRAAESAERDVDGADGRVDGFALRLVGALDGGEDGGERRHRVVKGVGGFTQRRERGRLLLQDYLRGVVVHRVRCLSRWVGVLTLSLLLGYRLRQSSLTAVICA